MYSNQEQNKLNATAFYDLMFNQCLPKAAIQKYAGDTYIQHNPEVGDGKDAFINYFERMTAEYPGMCCKSFQTVPATQIRCFSAPTMTNQIVKLSPNICITTVC
jgi:predicted SnoaL-like aldol condensation-catalyzing enzyme